MSWSHSPQTYYNEIINFFFWEKNEIINLIYEYFIK